MLSLTPATRSALSPHAVAVGVFALVGVFRERVVVVGDTVTVEVDRVVGR